MKCKACGTENQDGQEYCAYCGSTLKRKMNGKMIGVIAGGVTLAVIMIGILTMVLLNQHTTKVYEETLDKGEKYLAEMNYDQAIIEYQELIDLNPEKEDGYMGLANAYMGKYEYDLAEAAIQDGIKMTNASGLVSLLGVLYEQRDMNITGDNISTDDLVMVEVSNTTLNTSVLNIIGEYTYNDYAFKYGSGTVNYSSSTGVTEVTYSGFDGTCNYYNTTGDSYRVDSKTSQPYANRKPNEVTFATIHSIFNDIDGVITLEKFEKLVGGIATVSFDATTGKNMVSAVYGKCTINIECDESGNIVSTTAWNQIVPMEVSVIDTDEDLGSISGDVINAVTGQGTSAMITVREGHGTNGKVIEEIDTNSNGKYTFAYADGEYTFEVSKTDFITEFFEVEIKNQKDVTGEDLVISPELEEGEIRVVLEWGSEPSDLDTHARGTASNGSSFHVYYGNDAYYVEGETVASLDVDDTNGNGPETLTVYDREATFEYWIEDFTESGTMSQSGATVKVYLPGTSSPKIYEVPSGVGNTWEVFKYEDGEISDL